MSTNCQKSGLILGGVLLSLSLLRSSARLIHTISPSSKTSSNSCSDSPSWTTLRMRYAPPGHLLLFFFYNIHTHVRHSPSPHEYGEKRHFDLLFRVYHSLSQAHHVCFRDIPAILDVCCRRVDSIESVRSHLVEFFRCDSRKFLVQLVFKVEQVGLDECPERVFACKTQLHVSYRESEVVPTPTPTPTHTHTGI